MFGTCKSCQSIQAAVSNLATNWLLYMFIPPSTLPDETVLRARHSQFLSICMTHNFVAINILILYRYRSLRRSAYVAFHWLPLPSFISCGNKQLQHPVPSWSAISFKLIHFCYKLIESQLELQIEVLYRIIVPTRRLTQTLAHLFLLRKCGGQPLSDLVRHGLALQLWEVILEVVADKHNNVSLFFSQIFLNYW